MLLRPEKAQAVRTAWLISSLILRLGEFVKFARADSNRVSKIIHDSGGFALPSCVIGPKNHHLNLLDSKLKPILTCSLTFARVSRSLPVFSSGFEWLMMMSIFTLIGWCYCFDSGLLNPK